MAAMDTVVTIDSGSVEGKRGRGSRRGTLSWKGIPFAAPPVAGKRLQAPEPVTPWPGVLACHEYGNAPIQDKLFTATGRRGFQPRSEDCLTLNVFAPASRSSRPRPVLVFIYGGAYILGATSTPIYDASYLVRARDVIVVTVNYRVGPIGFADLSGYSTPERRFDANVGLLDMIAGLEWVQRNIAAFGGDAERVTVFGESAGGAAVVSLLSSPAAKGLFSGAIAQSPAPDLVVSAENSAIYADEFVRLVADPSRRSGPERTEPPLDPDEVARIIDGASAHELLRAGNQMLGFARAARLPEPMPWAPTVGGPSLPQKPLDAAQGGTTHPVPLIIGTNRDEGELFARFWNILPDAAQLLVGLDDPEIRAELEILYPGGRADVRQSADAVFWEPTIRFAGDHSSTAPTYVYRYDYAPAVLRLSEIGATHATELLALFGIYRDPIGLGLAAAGSWSSTKRITAVMQSNWSWFARSRVPSPTWPQYRTDSRQVMILADPPRVARDPDGERRAAWARVRTLLDAL